MVNMELIVSEVQEATGLSPGLALEVAARHTARMERMASRYNAWLLGRLVMWLTDGERTKLAVAALPLALGMRGWWHEGRKIECLEDQADAMGVDAEDLRSEVARAREQLSGE